MALFGRGSGLGGESPIGGMFSQEEPAPPQYNYSFDPGYDAPQDYSQAQMADLFGQQEQDRAQGVKNFGEDPYYTDLLSMYDQMKGAGNIDMANNIAQEGMRYRDPYNQMKLQGMQQELNQGAGDPEANASQLIQMGQEIGDEKLINLGRERLYSFYGLDQADPYVDPAQAEQEEMQKATQESQKRRKFGKGFLNLLPDYGGGNKQLKGDFDNYFKR